MANFTFSSLSSKVQEMGNPIVVNLLCDLEQAESGTDIIKAMDGYDNLMALVNQGQP